MKNNDTAVVKILYAETPVKGSIGITDGKLKKLEINGCKGQVKGDSFNIPSASSNIEIILKIQDARTDIGPNPTIVNVQTENNPFSFLLRDVLNSEMPVFVPEYGIAVTKDKDTRNY